MRYLCDGLEENRTLKTLILKWNGLENEGGRLVGKVSLLPEGCMGFCLRAVRVLPEGCVGAS